MSSGNCNSSFAFSSEDSEIWWTNGAVCRYIQLEISSKNLGCISDGSEGIGIFSGCPVYEIDYERIEE